MKLGIAILILSLSAAFARELTCDDGRVKFFVPEEYSLLNADELAGKYAKENLPDFAVGNNDRSLIVSVQLSDFAFTRKEINAMKDKYAEFLSEQMPGMKWVSKDFVNLNGRTWLAYEFLTPSTHDVKRNILLVTSHRDRMLLVNFAVDGKSFTVNNELIRMMMRTLTMK